MAFNIFLPLFFSRNCPVGLKTQFFYAYDVQLTLPFLYIFLLSLSQLVYQLFTTNLEPGEEDAKIVMQMAEESVRAQERDPYTAFSNRVRELNYGNSYFLRVSLTSL